jgi:general nucleoside transport system permease protein
VTASAVAIQGVSQPIPWRRYALGVLYLVMAAFVFVVCSYHTLPSTNTTITVNGNNYGAFPGLVVPTGLFCTILALVLAVMGVLQITGLGRAVWLMGVAIFVFVLAFMVWAARENSLDVVNVVESALLGTIPIAIGAMSGVVCERAGVINIAIEGQMLTAAFISTLIGGLTGNIIAALVAGIVSGAVLGWLLALLALRYAVDQIIAGFVIDVFATGFTSYLSVSILQVNPNLNSSGQFSNVNIAGLSNVPILGPLVFGNNVFVYIMVAVVVVLHIALFYTRWGLRARSVGEHPIAAATVGINPIRIRYVNVILGGALSGLAGSFFTLGATGRFDQTMTSGQGFIALVAVILGGWKPVGSFLAALLFGFAVSLQTVLGIFNVNIDPNLLGTLPYVITILAVAGIVGRTRPPASDGQPYIQE